MFEATGAINCFGAIRSGYPVIYYSHLIPIVITMTLALWVLVTSQNKLLAKKFFWFSFFISLWLVGDIIAWVSQDYAVISAAWALLDYINIIFYLFALYFFLVFVGGKDISWTIRFVFLVLSLPALVITLTGQSILAFNQANCEAINNDFLIQYKLVVELLVVLAILWAGARKFFVQSGHRRKQIMTVGLSLICFLVIFSVTEYIASQTGVYEINLYGLLSLPIFLLIIAYSFIHLQVFNLRFLGMWILIVMLLVVVSSQFLLLERSTDKVLTVITVVVSVGFGALLLQNIVNEQRSKKEIEVLAAKLTASNNELEETAHKQAEMFADIAHELQSPLAIAIGNLSTIRSANDDGAVDLTSGSLRRLSGMANNLLLLARADLGKLELIKRECDACQLLQDVHKEMTAIADAKGLTFEVNCAPGRSVIMADKDKLKSAFQNILSNAFKYTPNLGTVNVTLQSTADNILVCFFNSGEHIPKTDMDHLFDRFYRRPIHKQSAERGTGLGLAISKTVIEEHGGKITCQNVDPSGVEFTVELPSS